MFFVPLHFSTFPLYHSKQLSSPLSSYLNGVQHFCKSVTLGTAVHLGGWQLEVSNFTRTNHCWILALFKLSYPNISNLYQIPIYITVEQAKIKVEIVVRASFLNEIGAISWTQVSIEAPSDDEFMYTGSVFIRSMYMIICDA